MKETAEEKTTGSSFTKVPLQWSARKDVPLLMRVIVAYIYTRANIDNMDWGLVAADIVNQWGLPKSTVSGAMKELESKGIIRLIGWKKNKGKFPSKVFQIDREKLETLMTPPSPPVRMANRHGSIDEPPRFNRRTATVRVANLEEDVLKEEDKKKSTKEEPKIGGSSESPSFTKPTVSESKPSAIVTEFLSKSLKEQKEWLADIEANRTMLQDLKAGKEVRWTNDFEDYFANM